jgi:hypothetical protein
MKSSEAKPLSAEELETLRSLFQRWVLCEYPYYGGSSEESDAIQTYCDVSRAAKNAKEGKMPVMNEEDLEELKERLASEGEQSLKDYEW